MAYERKYRAKTSSQRQGKSIYVDILAEDANTISGWSNSVGTPWETFTSSNTHITSAINTSGSAICYSDFFSVTDGDCIFVRFPNYTLNSGAHPDIYLNSSGVRSNKVTMSGSGEVAVRLVSNYTGSVAIQIDADAASNWDSGDDIEVFSELQFGETPVVISQRIPGNPFDGQIIGSEAIIHFMSESALQFSEFFDCTNREYQAKVYFDDTNVWNGYLTPGMYEEPYIDPPYEIELVANDGIGDLRNIEYEEDGESDLRTIIDDLLNDYLDVNWSWYDYVLNATTGFQETTYTSGIASSVKVNLSRIVADSLLGYPTCYDLLDAICKTFDARFIMDRGYWRFYRVAGQRSASHYYTLWQKGAGSSSGTESNKRNITGGNASDANINCFIGNHQRLGILPAFREFTLIHDYGYRNIIWEDGGFEYSDITEYWEAHNSFSLGSANRVGKGDIDFVALTKREFDLYSGPETMWQIPSYLGYLKDLQWIFMKSQVYIPEFVDPGYCIYLGTGDTDKTDILAQDGVHYKKTWAIQNTASANYALKVKFEAMSLYEGGSNVQPGFYVRIYNASDDRWLAYDATDTFPDWLASESNVNIDFTKNGEWETFEIRTPELDATYEYTIHVYLSTMCYSVQPDSSDGSWFDNIEVTVIRLDEEMAVDNDVSETLSTDNNINNVFTTRLFGDVDEEGYEDILYQGYMKAVESSPPYAYFLTKGWQVDASRDQTLIEHSADLHRCMRETPLRKLTGTFYGLNNFMTVYTDTNQSKDFFTNYTSWNLKEMTWEGEFIELRDAQTEITNLITGWTNDPVYDWDTFAETDEVIDFAIETTGDIASAYTNTIAHQNGEEFIVEWDVTKNSGDWAKIIFAGDNITLDAETGSDTLTATSTGNGTLEFGLSNTETANYGECNIYLYRKYGY